MNNDNLGPVDPETDRRLIAAFSEAGVPADRWEWVRLFCEGIESLGPRVKPSQPLTFEQMGKLEFLRWQVEQGRLES